MEQQEMYSHSFPESVTRYTNKSVIKTLCICMHAKSLQLCAALYDPMDCSPSGSSVHGILQARILEWVAMPFSRESSWPRDRTHVSHISSIGRSVWSTSTTLEAPIKALSISQLSTVTLWSSKHINGILWLLCCWFDSVSRTLWRSGRGVDINRT